MVYYKLSIICIRIKILKKKIVTTTQLLYIFVMYSNYFFNVFTLSSYSFISLSKKGKHQKLDITLTLCDWYSIEKTKHGCYLGFIATI